MLWITYLAPTARNYLPCREGVHIQAFLGAEVVHLIVIINSLSSRQVFIKLSLAKATLVWVIWYFILVNQYNYNFKITSDNVICKLEGSKARYSAQSAHSTCLQHLNFNCFLLTAHSAVILDDRLGLVWHHRVIIIHAVFTAEVLKY